MARTKTGLTPSEYAVLGLLSQKADYGYRLQPYFAKDSGLGLVCPVEPSMLYAILKSLAGLELIDGQWDTSQYPPRAIYSITTEGEAAFQRWLRSPVARIREIRSDFLIKLYFAMQTDDDLTRDLLEAQLEACREYSGELAMREAALQPGSFEALVLSSKSTASRLTEAWLEQCLEAIEAGVRATNAGANTAS